MSRYVIARHAGLPGVRLSKLGHWGNLPFADDDAAVVHARRDAGGDGSLGISIERPAIVNLRRAT